VDGTDFAEVHEKPLFFAGTPGMLLQTVLYLLFVCWVSSWSVTGGRSHCYFVLKLPYVKMVFLANLCDASLY
jgi:hypothetical protein